MSDVFNEVLGQVDGMVKSAVAGRERPVVTKLDNQAAVTQFNADMQPAFQQGTEHLAQQSADLQKQPSLVTGQDAAADKAARLDPLKSTSFTEDVAAAAKRAFETNLTMSAWKAFMRDRPEYKVDPSFDWAAVRNEVVGKYGPEHEGKLERARSAEELKAMTDSLDQQRKDEQIMGRSITGTIAGSLADPLTLFMGIGEAKGLYSMWKGMNVARSAKIIDSAVVAGTSGAAQEAARQKLQYGAVDDPLGVGAAAVFATAMGTAGAAWATRTGTVVREAMATGSGASVKEGVDKALASLPPAATPEEFVERQQFKAYTDFTQSAQESVERVKGTPYTPPADLTPIFPDVLASVRTGEKAAPDATGVPTNIKAGDAERSIIDFSRGYQERVVADKEAQTAWQKFVGKFAEHTTLFDDFGKIVEKSQSATAKTLAMVLGEDATGRFRRYTPDTAIYKDRLKKVYESHLLPITTEFNSWINRKGYSALDLNNALGQGERDFNRALRLEVEARFNTRHLSGEELKASDAARWATTDPEIIRAADQLDKAHSFARETWGGHDEVVKQSFGDNSRGYLLRKLDGEYLHKLAATDKKAYREYLESYARAMMRSINAGIDERIAAGEKRKVFKKVGDNRVAEDVDLEHMTEAKALGIAETIFDDARQRAAGLEGPTVGLLSHDGREQLKNLMRSKRMPEDEIEDFFSIVDETVGDRGRSARAKGRMDIDIVTPDPVTGRVPLDVFDNNVFKLTARYADEFAGRTAMARAGIKNDAELKTWISAAWKDGATPEEMEVIQGMANRLLGRTDRKANRAADAIHNWARTAMLGQATFAQAIETATVAANTGIWATVKQIPGIPKLMKDLVKGDITHAELKELAPLLGDVGHDYKLLKGSRMADNMHADDGAAAQVVDLALKYNKNVNNLLSGFNVVHGVQRQMAVLGMKQRVYDMLMSGKVHQRLEDAGIHGEWIDRIKGQLDKHSSVDEQGVRFFNTDKWDDPQAVEKIADSMHRVSNQLIQGHMVGETSAFMDGNVGRVLTGFRTFPIVALRKQLIRNMYMADSVTWTNIVTSVSLSAVLYSAKVNLNAVGMSESNKKKYLEQRLSDSALAMGALQYASMSSILPDLFAAGANWAGGERRFDSDFSSVPTLGFMSRAMETGSEWAHSLTDDDYRMKNPVKKALGLVNSTLPLVWVATALEK